MLVCNGGGMLGDEGLKAGKADTALEVCPKKLEDQVAGLGPSVPRWTPARVSNLRPNLLLPARVTEQKKTWSRVLDTASKPFKFPVRHHTSIGGQALQEAQIIPYRLAQVSAYHDCVSWGILSAGHGEV